MCFVPYYISFLFQKLKINKPTHSATASELKKQLADELQNRLGWVLTTVNVATKAAVLHPSHKYSNFLDKKLKEEIWNSLKTEVLSAVEWKDDEAVANLISAEVALVRKRLESAEKFGVVPEDPLVFWRDWKDGGRIGVLARKYLGIPATSTPSERCFSDIGYVYNERRANLLPENVEKIVFIRENCHLLPKDLAERIKNFK